MRRTATVLAATLALSTVLAPLPAVAQQSTPNCPHLQFSVDREVISPGATVTVTVRRFASEGQTVKGTLTRLFPEPAADVRQTSDTATVTTWPLRLGESHRFEHRYEGTRENCTPLGRPSNGFFDVSVQPTVGIAAVRNAPRDYSFTGRVLPARTQRVTLWRVDPATGKRVLTATSTVGGNGLYRFDRRFTGSGRYGFQVDVAATASNLAGKSPVRPTVVH